MIVGLVILKIALESVAVGVDLYTVTVLFSSDIPALVVRAVFVVRLPVTLRNTVRRTNIVFGATIVNAVLDFY